MIRQRMSDNMSLTLWHRINPVSPNTRGRISKNGRSTKPCRLAETRLPRSGMPSACVSTVRAMTTPCAKNTALCALRDLTAIKSTSSPG